MLGQLGPQTAFQHRLEHLGQESSRPGQTHPIGAHPRHQLVQQLLVEHRSDRGRGVAVRRPVSPRQRQPRRRRWCRRWH
jgi:hypothetical protein